MLQRRSLHTSVLKAGVADEDSIRILLLRLRFYFLQTYLDTFTC